MPSLNQHDIVRAIQTFAAVDAIYLYGSRATHTERPNSDWDIAVLFSDYEHAVTRRLLRPQMLEAFLERSLHAYGKISVVDLEAVPVYLQVSILSKALKWYDRGVPHVRRVEQGILSTWEKDYERYCV
jgi:predicted nucleotidyltransferase